MLAIIEQSGLSVEAFAPATAEADCQGATRHAILRGSGRSQYALARCSAPVGHVLEVPGEAARSRLTAPAFRSSAGSTWLVCRSKLSCGPYRLVGIALMRRSPYCTDAGQEFGSIIETAQLTTVRASSTASARSAAVASGRSSGYRGLNSLLGCLLCKVAVHPWQRLGIVRAHPPLQVLSGRCEAIHPATCGSAAQAAYNSRPSRAMSRYTRPSVCLWRSYACPVVTTNCVGTRIRCRYISWYNPCATRRRSLPSGMTTIRSTSLPGRCSPRVHPQRADLGFMPRMFP